jgi:integrase
MLTGARSREIAAMEWSELDSKTGTWTLPAKRSKNHRANTLMLPKPALAILAEVPIERWDGRDFESDGYVFSRHGGANLNREKLQIMERSGTTNWWVHDIRRTVATGMGKLGIAPHVIECVLNHVSGFRGGVAGVYIKSDYERETTQALIRWSEHLMGLVEGRKGKVIALATKGR